MTYKIELNDQRSLVIEFPNCKFHQFWNSKGFQYIAEGIKCPYRKIPMVVLTADRNSLRTVPAEFYDSEIPGKLLEGYRIYYQENKIPRADWQAVKEVSEMLNVVIKKIAILEAAGCDCKEELDILNLKRITLRNYLNEIYDPKKYKLKFFPTDTERVTRSGYMAVKRAIEKVNEVNQDFAYILDKTIYCWQYLCYTPLPGIEIEIYDHTLD